MTLKRVSLSYGIVQPTNPRVGRTSLIPTRHLRRSLVFLFFDCIVFNGTKTCKKIGPLRAGRSAAKNKKEEFSARLRIELIGGFLDPTLARGTTVLYERRRSPLLKRGRPESVSSPVE